MSNATSATVTITNKLGLHARPAMVFVEAASKYGSAIAVRRCDGGPDAEPVDGKSIMQMMMLAATKGTMLEITAQGDDSADAIAELTQLVESNFDEE